MVAVFFFKPCLLMTALSGNRFNVNAGTSGNCLYIGVESTLGILVFCALEILMMQHRKNIVASVFKFKDLVLKVRS